MASPCDNRLTVNIKNLPILTDINKGDFLIVEAPDGTGILDFRNFLITLDNTTFRSTFLDYNTRINTVSADMQTTNDALTSLMATLTASLNSSLTELSASIVDNNLSTILNGTFVTLSSNGSTVTILNSSNINNSEISPNGSIVVNFTTNFEDPYYCVNTGGYYYDDVLKTSIPINLAVIQTTTNSITLKPLSGSGLSAASMFTRGWVNFKTV